jgi:prepilin-type processing-associated H-X9-DG protein
MTMSSNQYDVDAKDGISIGEWIAVILIVLVVAAILFPVFAHSRMDESHHYCASNLNQLGIGVAQYTQDYDERLMLGYCPTQMPGRPINAALTSGNTLGNGWAEQIYSYEKSTEVYHCPDDPTQPGGTTLEVDKATGRIPKLITVATNVPVSYGYNYDLAWAKKLGAASYPATTVLLFECQGENADVAGDIPGELDANSPAGNGIHYCGFNGSQYVGGPWQGGPGQSQPSPISQTVVHNGGANYGFLDGHVKWLKPDQISAGWNNLSGAGCGAFPNSYTTGTTKIPGGRMMVGQPAASAAQVASGKPCDGVVPVATFSPE